MMSVEAARPRKLRSSLSTSSSTAARSSHRANIEIDPISDRVDLCPTKVGMAGIEPLGPWPSGCKRISNDLDPMGCDPDVQLLKANLQGFFEVAHGLPILRAILNVNTRAEELIVIQGALVEPEPTNDHGVRAHRPEQADQLVISLDEFLPLDGPTVVREQREQDFESDHEPPSLRHPWHAGRRLVGRRAT